MFDANRKKLVSDGPKREKTIPKLRPDLSLYLFCWAGGLVCVAIALGALAGFYAAAALAAATAFAFLAMARQMQVESRAERRAQDDRERQRRGSNRRLTER
jgi:membrane protein implicated in regulation of membrane protease activity